jgi:hypothetical protein
MSLDNRYLEVAESINKKIESMIKTMTKSVESMAKTLDAISKQITDSFKYLDFSWFDEIGKELEKVEDDIIQFKTIIVRLGYPPHEDMPVSDIRRIVADYNEFGEEYVKKYLDDLMFEIYDEKYLDDILLKWEQTKLLSSRISILRNVIKCHNQQMYNASIPTLLPQLEGIIVDAFQHKGELRGHHLGVYLKHLLIKPNEEESYSFEDAIHIYYMQHILVHFEHGKEIRSEVSRHAILHGGLTNYGSRENSLKLILLFDFLSDCVSKITEETIVVAKKEIQENNNNKKKKNK